MLGSWRKNRSERLQLSAAHGLKFFTTVANKSEAGWLIERIVFLIA